MPLLLPRQTAATTLRAAVAAGLIGAGYLLVGVEHPTASAVVRAELAAPFSFSRAEIPPAPGKPLRGIADLNVNPSVEHMKAWVAAAGSAIALGDLDGDGLPNDACLVDVRTDSVTVEPVPGTGDRYAPIVLEPPARAVDEPVHFATGCLIADLNEDGLQDVVVTYATRPPVAFLQTGSGYVAQELVDHSDEIWNTAASAVADFDGDGHLDLLFGNYFPDGDRMFDPFDPHAVTLNDSFSHAENGGSKQFLLWQSATPAPNPSVHFRRVQNVLPDDVNHGWTLAFATADFTGDLLPDLYVANDFGPDRLLHNVSTPGHLQFQPVEGTRTFTTPKSKVLGHDSFKGMGVDVGDLNGDGLLDMAVSNITSDFAFQESNFTFINTGDATALARGVAPFTDESEQLGLARSGFSWDVRFGDFNNSGALQMLQATGFIKGTVNQFPELHESAIANDALSQFPAAWPVFDQNSDLAGHEPNRLWVPGPDGRYVDIASQVGITTDEVTRGIATADVNGDGRLDFAEANQWEPSYVFINTCSACGAYVGLHLRLPLAPLSQVKQHDGVPTLDEPSRPAIGAEVRVQAPDGQSWVSYVDASNGHAGKRAPDIQFGLGNRPATTPLQVQVRYRDPHGQVRQVSFTTTPGWHTVQLPWIPGQEN